MGDGFAHQVNSLKNSVCDGRQGEEDDGGCADHHQLGGQFSAVTEDDLHDRCGENAHADATRDRDQHVELDGQTDFIFDLAVLSLGARVDNARDHRSSESRGDCDRHIGEQTVLVAVNTKQGCALFLGQSLCTHQISEHCIVDGSAELVDELAENDRSQRHEEGDVDRFPCLNRDSLWLRETSLVSLLIADHQDRQKDEGGECTAESSEGSAGCAVRTYVVTAGEPYGERVGSADADACVDDLLDDLGDRGRNHVSETLEVSADYAHDRENEDRRCHDF